MKYQPHNYQQYCIDRAVSDSALGLFLEPGLGKTSIALSAICELKLNRFAVHKALVIAPKKVAEDTWRREVAKWDHLRALRIQLVLGSAKKRIAALCTPADVYVINRENVVWLVDYYRGNWPFDMVVIDELTSFKSPSAKRFRALRSVRPYIHRVVGLTGTPAAKGYMDLWAQIYLLDGGDRLGRYITHYRDRYFYPAKYNGPHVFAYDLKDGAAKAIEDKISDICVSMRAADYLDLPPLLVDDRYVQLDTRSHKIYHKLERDMLVDVDAHTLNAVNAAGLTGKLLQMCNGAVYDENANAVEVHRCKLDALCELMEELQGQPAIIYYSYRHDRDRIKAALGDLDVRELRGPDDIAAWNAGACDALLAQPQSAGYGLNLQDGGHHVIWFGLPWSLELYQQAIDRLHRQGQRYPVYVHRLITVDGMDARVVDVLQQRGATQDALLDALKAQIKIVQAGG